MVYLLISLIVICVLAALAYLQLPKFGKLPSGERLARIEKSPNYRNGEFHNQIDTPMFADGRSFWSVLLENMRTKVDKLKPSHDIPTVKTNLHQLAPDQDIIVWLGHSSFFMQFAGKKILIDPVFSASAAPVSFVNYSFEGTNLYTAADMPEIDLLLLTHDHWDHLDYPTLMSLKPKVKQVITGLGMGSYLQHWGYPVQQIVEGDWYDKVKIDPQLNVYLVPARHYSGRHLIRNKTLWTGFVLESTDKRLLFSGDSGYGPHFAEIGQKFKHFDFVALDSGQYDARWPYIHMNPEESAQAAKDLGTQVLMPIHVGKYTLARHAWDEPFKRIEKASINQPYRLVTPEIGEPMSLDHLSTQKFHDWWQATSAPSEEHSLNHN